jgi:beta-lactamase superfamily II metal-dependent hydrolase
LRADVVIAGLPAVGEPLATEWLDVLRPKAVVIADSEFPVTRRASRELGQRLQRSGAMVLYTRHAGAVTFSIREGKWRVETARETIALE